MMTRFLYRAALSAHLVTAALCALLIGSGFGPSASAQSFDCRNARSADEKAICQDSRLGELDKQLADVYDRVGGKLSKQERQEFENHETAFVNARHRCGGHPGCIEQSYRNRLQELLSSLPDDPSSRSGSRGDIKRSDRQKASPENGKPEEAQTGAVDTKSATGEAEVQAPGQGPTPNEAKSAAPLPASAEPRSRPNGPAAASAVPNPPSRHEAEAALTGSPPAEKHSRRQHRTESAAVKPATPERDEPPVASAPPAPEKRPAPEKHPSKSGNSVSSEKAASERHPASAPSAAVPEKPPATGSTTAAEEPSNPPEKRHSRGKHVASGTSAPSPAPADQAQPASKPEIKWVNPAPSR
jgi:uncharacterized protein